jgi:2-dehydropantoate 2-reductase
MPTPAPTNVVPGVKRVAVMGAGAVGSYFGGMLARAGVPVTMIARGAYVEAVRRNGLFLDTVTFQERVAVEASSEPSAVRNANVVLFCVKGQDDEATARAIAPHLSADAILVSVQNGVDNVERIRVASGIDALPAVVYVAAAMPEPGHVKHSGRGDLVVGEFTGRNVGVESQSPRTEQIAAMFASAKVPCRISSNISADMWLKFITNCGANAVSAIAQASYGEIARYEESRELMRRVVQEAIAVGRAAGVRMPEAGFTEKWLENLGKFGDAFSSTAQDLAHGKRTEIESLNGYILRRGAELGVPTPSNFALYAMVKLLEETAAKREHEQGRPASAAQ